MRIGLGHLYHSPVSMVTRSNGFPLLDVKTPSLVTFFRIGAKSLQGAHQLSGGDGQHF